MLTEKTDVDTELSGCQTVSLLLKQLIGECMPLLKQPLTFVLISFVHPKATTSKTAIDNQPRLMLVQALSALRALLLNHQMRLSSSVYKLGYNNKYAAINTKVNDSITTEMHLSSTDKVNGILLQILQMLSQRCTCTDLIDTAIIFLNKLLFYKWKKLLLTVQQRAISQLRRQMLHDSNVNTHHSGSQQTTTAICSLFQTSCRLPLHTHTCENTTATANGNVVHSHSHIHITIISTAISRLTMLSTSQ